MRWLFHVDSQEVGGTEILLHSLFRHLRHRGWTVLLVSPSGPSRDYLGPCVDAIISPPHTLEAWRGLLTSTKPAGAVTVQGTVFALAASCKEVGMPCLWICGHPPSQLPFYSEVCALGASLFDRAIACSRFIEQELGTIPGLQITTIPSGIDTRKFKPGHLADRLATRRQLNIPDNAFLLMYAARFAPYKNHADTVRLLAKLQPQIKDSHLLLCGSGAAQEMHRNLMTIAQSHQLESKVHLFKASPDCIHAFFRIADLFVSPAVHEGLGMALLEAMATELPVVIANSGGMIEPLQHGMAGYVVPPRDINAFSQAVLQLYGKPEQAKHFGQAGRKVVQRHYSIEQTCLSFSELLQQVVAPSSSVVSLTNHVHP